METRHPSKVLVGLLVAGAAIGLLGLPASATTNDATVTSGTIDLLDAGNVFIDDLVLSELGTPCAPHDGEVGMTGTTFTGSWSMAFQSDVAVTISGTPFRVALMGVFAGTYVSTSTTGSGDLAAVFRRTTGSGSCTYLSTAGSCSVDATSITVTGTHTVTTPPLIAPGNTFRVSGSNGSGGDFGFETDAGGTAADCGALIGLVDGSVHLVNVQAAAS
jgi:hypothetical protein